MFAIRFDNGPGRPPCWAGRFGKHTTAGGWGWMSYEEAELFDTVEAAQAALAAQYPGDRGKGASIVDAFDNNEATA